MLDRYLLIKDHRHGEIPGGLIWIEVKRRRDTCITFCIQGASVSAIPGAMLTPRRCRATREEWILEFVIFLAFLYWACDPHEITCKRAERGHVSSLIARSRTYHSVWNAAEHRTSGHCGVCGGTAGEEMWCRSDKLSPAYLRMKLIDWKARVEVCRFIPTPLPSLFPVGYF